MWLYVYLVMYMRLLEVFKDFDILLRGKANFGKYNGTFLLVRRPNPKKITEQDLSKYVARLQQRFPERKFQVKVRKYRGKVYHIVDQDIWVRRRGRRRKRKKDRVPIFFDLEEQKIYVPESFVKRNKRLVGYILMRTLGTLGVSTVKWAKGSGH